MRSTPEMELRRFPNLDEFGDLLAAHRQRLDARGLTTDDLVEEVPEEVPSLIEEETKRQVRHNLEAGLIARAEDEELFRYSWRGLFFLYMQSVKDMVRLV